MSMGSPLPAAVAQADGDPGAIAALSPCAFCGAQCDEDDFCPGCSVFVCVRCDQRPLAGELFGPHRRSLHGAVERRELMREVERGRAALRQGRAEEAAAALNSIEALLRRKER